jgi:hypothetical protein
MLNSGRKDSGEIVKLNMAIKDALGFQPSAYGAMWLLYR